MLLVVLIPYLLPEYTWAKMRRQAVDSEIVYTYDALDRNGNRLTKTVDSTVYSYLYNALDQLVEEK